MATKYYIRIHIESAGTAYQADKKQSIVKSKAGHMWYETFLVPKLQLGNEEK